MKLMSTTAALLVSGLADAGDAPAPKAEMPDLRAADKREAGTTRQDGDPQSVRHPSVREGLDILVRDGRLVVRPGQARILGSMVTLQTEAVLEPAAPDPIVITGEGIRLWADPPKKWQSRTKLFGRSARLRRYVPHSLIPGTVRIYDRGGAEYRLDQDYVLDETWCAVALKPGGRLKENTPYLVDYTLGPKALDAVALDSRGRVSLIRGAPAVTCPLPPDPPPDGITLAHVYWPGAGLAALTQENVFPVGPPFQRPAAAREMSKRIPRTMAKLRAGEPLTIVCWGDSVTVGGDAEPRSQRYSDVFGREIRKRHPNVRIVNVSQGGSNSAHWLDDHHPQATKIWGEKRPKWGMVTGPAPDLVTIEFVNDAWLANEAAFRKRYDEILRRLHDAGAEVILITPHFTMRSMMGFTGLRQPESRGYVANLRRYAEERNLGLADASLRWEHLWREGVPYETLLRNGINHPDNRGHLLFAEELLTCFE